MDTPNSPYNEMAMWVGVAKFADMILWKSSDPYNWVTARIKEHLIENFNPFEICRLEVTFGRITSRQSLTSADRRLVH